MQEQLPGTAAESNAGRYGLLPFRGIRTFLCIRAITELPRCAGATQKGWGGDI